MRSAIRVFVLLPLIMGIASLAIVVLSGIFKVVGKWLSYDSTLALAELDRATASYDVLEIFGTGVGIGYVWVLILCLLRWYHGYWPGEEARSALDPLDDDWP